MWSFRFSDTVKLLSVIERALIWHIHCIISKGFFTSQIYAKITSRDGWQTVTEQPAAVRFPAHQMKYSCSLVRSRSLLIPIPEYAAASSNIKLLSPQIGTSFIGISPFLRLTVFLLSPFSPALFPCLCSAWGVQRLNIQRFERAAQKNVRRHRFLPRLLTSYPGCLAKRRIMYNLNILLL